MLLNIYPLIAQEMPSKKKDLEDAYQQHVQEISSLKNEMTLLKQRIENLESDKRKLGYEKDGLLQDLNSLDHQILELKKSQDSLKTELNETTNQLEVNYGINQKLKSLLKTLTESLAGQDSLTKMESTPYFIGNFMGTQTESVVKDQDGKDLIINGQKIKTPPIDHSFTLLSEGKVLLEQVNKNDQSVTGLSGTYLVTTDNDQVYEIECTLKNNENLTLDYLIYIDKSTEEITCTSGNQAPFKLLKNILMENIGEVITE
ncbi:hypothetical protein IFO69_15815 [Echinicola sp. CAU 1574]|uniref:Uncharacterized protein n=1 Tax=Echinicola arenosa TaxID=2774144 RepID=A0ABR9AN68_9BACT|nr:hypothetical protein [Echinicola arenosa]MBD8490222.1 hypothetical protein [Echinicola arenosa]